MNEELYSYTIQHSMIHAIYINPIQEKITIVFHSDTHSSFVTNHQIWLNTLLNPMKPNYPMQSPTIGIHCQFSSDLLSTTEDQELIMDGIMDQLKSILDIYPTYSITTTGHSWGGAISTLFSYMMASKEETT